MKLYGVEGDSQRWEKCTELTDYKLGFATGALYVDRYFSEADRLRVNICLKFFILTVLFRRSHVKTRVSESS